MWRTRAGNAGKNVAAGEGDGVAVARPSRTWSAPAICGDSISGGNPGDCKSRTTKQKKRMKKDLSLRRIPSEIRVAFVNFSKTIRSRKTT